MSIRVCDDIYIIYVITYTHTHIYVITYTYHSYILHRMSIRAYKFVKSYICTHHKIIYIYTSYIRVYIIYIYTSYIHHKIIYIYTSYIRIHASEYVKVYVKISYTCEDAYDIYTYIFFTYSYM